MNSQLAGNGFSQIVGLSYSTVSGAGLTYQHLFNPNYRVKMAGLLFWDESTKDMNKDILAYNAGGEFHRTLIRQISRDCMLLQVGSMTISVLQAGILMKYRELITWIRKSRSLKLSALVLGLG
ncbi:MAG: hypothetical protein V4642_12990 [Bacteroidota bacterium]